jgi:hypothetical protein
LKISPTTSDTDAEKKAYSYVNKFITGVVFTVGIYVASVIVYVVTCSVAAAIAFVAGACTGAYVGYQYLSG